MRKSYLLPCAFLLAAAAPAQAAPNAVVKQVAPSEVQQSVTLSGGSAAQPAQPVQEKKICKQLPTTGSRLPNKACLTEREWKQVEDDLQH